jgi:hypothetical protein
MTGAMTPEQAGFELRNISKEYNQSNAVKQVLMDQSLANVSNAASVNPRLAVGRAENPNWDYETGAFRQESLEDLESGKSTIDASGYGLVEDPGLFEDFAGELAQIHEQYIKESGVTDFYYDKNTGQHKETATNNVIEISEDRIRDMVEDYVYGGKLSESDKQSVLYRIARYNRMDPDNPYTDEQLIEDLMQVNAFRPYMSTSKSQDMSASGRGGGSKGGSKSTEAPMPVVTTELGAEASGIQYTRSSLYDIDPKTPATGMRKLLASDESRREAANKKLGIKGYKLKEGSTIENPEFVYSSGNLADQPVLEPDMNDARGEFNEYKTDINFFEGVERMASAKFKQSTGKSFTDFMNETEDKYSSKVEEWLLSSATDRNEGIWDKIFQDKNSLTSLLGKEGVANTLYDVQQISENAIESTFDETILVPLNDVMPESSFIALTALDDAGVVEGDAIAVALDQRRLQFYKDLEAKTGTTIKTSDRFFSKQTGLGAAQFDRHYIPLELAAELNSDLKQVVNEHITGPASIEFLKHEEPSVHRTYMSAQESITGILEENNRYKIGMQLTTLEGKDGRRDHRILQDAIRSNESLTLRRSEGKPGSGELAGNTMRQVYEALGPEVSAKDFRAGSVYLNEGPQGEVQMYARMQWEPKSNTEVTGDIDSLKVKGDTESTSYRDFDVNITQYMDDFFDSDVTLVYHAASIMKDQVYTMEVGDTRPVYIPSKYGPAAEVNISMFSGGRVSIEGSIYGEDSDGNVIKKDVMDYYHEMTGTPKNSMMSVDKAAEFASQVASSAYGVSVKHPDLFGKKGEYLGSDVPTKVEDRRTQAKEALTNNVSKITSKFSSKYNESFTEYEEPDQKTVDELFEIMEFETAGSFHPNQRNVKKGKGTAVGLIQFYKDKGEELVKTVGKKKFTFAELGRMSISEQINKVVVPYLNEVGGKVESVDDLYFAVFMPAFTGMNKNLSIEDAVDLAKSRGADMTNLEADSLKTSNPAFKGANTLSDVLSTVRGYKK